MKKRIGIDARFYGSLGKGLGRYTQKLIEKLEIIENENPQSEREYFIFLRKANFDEYQPKNDNFHKVLADYRWYTFSEQLNMPRLLNKYNLDLVHFPHFNVPIFYFRPFVITIHDLILLNFPTVRGTTLSPIFYWLKFWAYRLVIGMGVKRSKKIITVSEFTKMDLCEHYSGIDNKIEVTLEACDVSGEDAEDGEKDFLIMKKYGIIKPYALYVGNAYPHKNLDRLIQAFSALEKKENSLKLVLVGREDFFYKKLKGSVKELGSKNIIFTDFVSDDDLDIVYRNSKIYVFPSLYEGFGLPPLEAMSRNVPVTCSDHACMKEILGDGAYYFNGEDEGSIASAISKLNSNSDLRNDLIYKGAKQVKLYSWKKMAKETLGVYESF
ncbi:glycosyltransferase family 4 protein [Patescibacteria group bacterium]